MVDNVDTFSADVVAGRWDTVLPQARLGGSSDWSVP
jgi:hypothetical protein